MVITVRSSAWSRPEVGSSRISSSGLKDPCTRLVVSWDSSLTACVLPARTVPTASDGEGDAEEDAGDGDTGDTGTGDTVVVATAAGRGCCCRCARAGLAVYVADP